MGLGTGVRELVYVLVVAVAGLVLATAVALAPWHVERPVTGTPTVDLVVPGGVAGRR